MNTAGWMGIMFALLLVCGVITAISLDKRKLIESDLCYSLKTNRILLEGYEIIYEEKNISRVIIEEASDILEILEDRNWMGCETDALVEVDE